MALTREEVLNVAKLARLKFTPEEIEKFQVELNDILGYIDMLDEINTDEVKPLIQVNNTVNNLREDEVRESLSVEKALSNAPDSGDGAVIVPKVFPLYVFLYISGFHFLEFVLLLSIISSKLYFI